MPSNAETLGHAESALQFVTMALSVVHTQGVHLETLGAGDGQGGGAVETAADENHGAGHG